MLSVGLLGSLVCIAASGVVFLIELCLIEAVDDGAKPIGNLGDGQQLDCTNDGCPFECVPEETERESAGATATFRSPVNV